MMAHDPAVAATNTAASAPAPMVARSGVLLRVVKSIGLFPREIHRPSAARAGLNTSQGKRECGLL
jgi:hypothetical protein